MRVISAAVGRQTGFTLPGDLRNPERTTIRPQSKVGWVQLSGPSSPGRCMHTLWVDMGGGRHSLHVSRASISPSGWLMGIQARSIRVQPLSRRHRKNGLTPGQNRTARQQRPIIQALGEYESWPPNSGDATACTSKMPTERV